MIKLWVYGTLKKGFSNHRLLENAEFLGYDFILADKLGWINFPLISKFDESNLKNAKWVLIEKYEINDDTLKQIDALEGHPNWYKREKVKTLYDDEVYVYFNEEANNVIVDNWKKVWNFYSWWTSAVLKQEILNAIEYAWKILAKM